MSPQDSICDTPSAVPVQKVTSEHRLSFDINDLAKEGVPRQVNRFSFSGRYSDKKFSGKKRSPRSSSSDFDRIGGTRGVSIRSGSGISKSGSPYIREIAAPSSNSSSSLGAESERRVTKAPIYRAPHYDRSVSQSGSKPSDTTSGSSGSSLRELAEKSNWGSSGTPSSHEIVRKVSSRSPLDGGHPSDENFISAFTTALQMVCDENESLADEAYPREHEESEVIWKVFPVEVARRYSPDFINHVLSHLKLSRHSLAAALVYLDRAQKTSGHCMTVCNKNINQLVLCACVIACRVIERRGYSDEIVAMLAGMKDASALRCSVSFCLEKLGWDAVVTREEMKVYEKLLQKLCDKERKEGDIETFEASLINSRNRVLRLYYPPSSMKVEDTKV